MIFNKYTKDHIKGRYKLHMVDSVKGGIHMDACAENSLNGSLNTIREFKAEEEREGKPKRETIYSIRCTSKIMPLESTGPFPNTS